MFSEWVKGWTHSFFPGWPQMYCCNQAGPSGKEWGGCSTKLPPGFLWSKYSHHFWDFNCFSVCLLFSSSKSLLNVSCIFSMLFPRFWITFTIIILNYFSGWLPISSSFVRSGGFCLAPSSALCFSVFPFCLTYCLGSCFAGCRFVVPIVFGVCPQWVRLVQWVVRIFKIFICTHSPSFLYLCSPYPPVLDWVQNTNSSLGVWTVSWRIPGGLNENIILDFPALLRNLIIFALITAPVANISATSYYYLIIH